MRQGTLYIFLLALCLCSCNERKTDGEFTDLDGLRLEVDGKRIFTFSENLCQTYVNLVSRTFGMHSDSMSDYVYVSLGEMPKEEGQTITGSIAWTTAYDEVSKKNITLQVLKLQGDRVWLWNASGRIGLEIVISE